VSRKTSGKQRPQPPEPPTAETDELRAKLEPVLAEKLKRPQDAHEVAELVATAVGYSGPLPPSSEMAGYEDAVPGSGERIIAMAEREQAFRHAMVTREMSITERKSNANSRVMLNGQAVGTTVVVLLVFGGLGLAALEYELPGYTGFVTGVLLYASNWIVGRRPPSKPEPEKSTERGKRGGARP